MSCSRPAAGINVGVMVLEPSMERFLSYQRFATQWGARLNALSTDADHAQGIIDAINLAEKDAVTDVKAMVAAQAMAAIEKQAAPPGARDAEEHIDEVKTLTLPELRAAMAGGELLPPALQTCVCALERLRRESKAP
mgnify:CR=1 FL=1